MTHQSYSILLLSLVVSSACSVSQDSAQADDTNTPVTNLRSELEATRDCSDTPPPGTAHSCTEQASWGKCNESWMNGYCDKSCNRCEGTSSCDDTPPAGTTHSCAQQASWGKCGESWMIGSCNRSCGRCGGTVANRVRIKSITAFGTGCAAGQSSTSISADGHNATVAFTSLSSSIDRGQAFSTSDCQLSINADAPSGFTFAMESVEIDGYVQMNRAGMESSQSAGSYFQGDRASSSQSKTTWKGPTDRGFSVRDTVGTGDLSWQPCNLDRSLQIPLRVTLNNSESKDGSGNIRVDRIKNIKFAVKACR